MNRTVVAAVSVLIGAASWTLGVRIGPGPTALNAGGWYLLILGVAGFIVAAIERDLSWTSLAGLYAGQVAALFVQAFTLDGLAGAEPLAWQPLFIVSVTLAAAVGGALGAVAPLRRGPSGPPTAHEHRAAPPVEEPRWIPDP